MNVLQHSVYMALGGVVKLCKQQSRCQGVLLQDFLGFAPSKHAMAIVQTSVQAHAVQQQQAAALRLQHAAALTAQRCAAAPMYGQGLRQVNIPRI